MITLDETKFSSNVKCLLVQTRLKYPLDWDDTIFLCEIEEWLPDFKWNKYSLIALHDKCPPQYLHKPVSTLVFISLSSVCMCVWFSWKLKSFYNSSFSIKKYIYPTQASHHVHYWCLHQILNLYMMSSNENIFQVTGPLWGESTGHWQIPFAKASNTELWYFLWSTPEQTVEQTMKMLMMWDTIVLIMRSL